MGKIRRCPLSKRIPRDFIKNFGKYLGMILILVCTVSIGSSFQSTLDGATRYLDDIKENNLQEDGFFEVADRLTEDSTDFYTDKQISLCENFYATENSFLDDVKVLIFDERTLIDLPTVFDGALPKSDDEIALDHVFARGRGIKTGDRIRLLNRDYLVSGTVSLPDYTSLFMNNTDLLMNTSHFCVSVVSKTGFQALDEDSVTYRYSYRFDNRNLSDSKKSSLAEDMQKHLLETGSVIQTFLRSDQNQSITFLEMDMGSDGPFMVVFVYMLVALIAFVFAILTGNAIEQEAVIIGTLLASGYKKSEILWHYLQPTLIVAVLGSVIGNALGYTVMIEPFVNIYYTTYSIGPIDVHFSVPTFLLTTVLPVLLMLGINCLMLTRKLSLSPLKFLRRELKKGKQKKAVKLPDFSFLRRFRIRVILQNKGSYLMLFIGIFLASFLLMFGIGLDPLMKHYTDSMDESLPYSYQYLLKAPADIQGGEKIQVYEMKTWFELGKKDLSISLMGIGTDSRFFQDALSDKGVSISSALSKKLNLQEGDFIKLRDPYKDKDYELEIGKIYPYNASMAIFLSREELNGLLSVDAASYNCILSEKELEIDDKYLAKVISRSDVLGAADQMMSSFSTVILFINLFSVVVYMVLMYILTKVVIDKNALSISFMKVFGYEPKEIRKLYLTATTLIVTASLVICIPVEIALFKLVLVYLSSMIEGYLEFYLPATVYVEIVVIGLLAYFCINALHIRGIGRIPMTEALKNRE